MSLKRKDRVSSSRSFEQLEDDALELSEKGYSFEGIGDLQGVSGPTAKGRVMSAKVRRAEQSQSAQGQSPRVVPFKKEA